MKKILLILIYILSCISFSQAQTLDTLYFNNKNSVVKFKIAADKVRYIYSDPENIDNNVFKQYSTKDDILQQEGGFVSNADSYLSIVLNGEVTTYDEQGRKTAIATYDKGKKHGKHITSIYFSNRVTEILYTYKSGLKNGKSHVKIDSDYVLQGMYKDDLKNGKFIERGNSDGIEYTYIFENGVKNGDYFFAKTLNGKEHKYGKDGKLYEKTAPIKLNQTRYQSNGLNIILECKTVRSQGKFYKFDIYASNHTIYDIPIDINKIKVIGQHKKKPAFVMQKRDISVVMSQLETKHSRKNSWKELSDLFFINSQFGERTIVSQSTTSNDKNLDITTRKSAIHIVDSKETRELREKVAEQLMKENVVIVEQQKNKEMAIKNSYIKSNSFIKKGDENYNCYFLVPYQRIDSITVTIPIDNIEYNFVFNSEFLF